MRDEAIQVDPSGNPFAVESFVEGQSPFAPYRRVPRLGIIHLMAWTAAMAVLMKYWMAMDVFAPARYGTIPWAFRVVHQTLAITHCASVSAGVVGTSVLVLGTLRGFTGPMHPGHRLICISTAIGLLAQATYLLAFAQSQLEDVDVPFKDVYWYQLAIGILSLPASMLFFHAAAKSAREGKRWQLLFVCYGLLSASHVLLYTLGAFNHFLLTLIPLPLGAISVGVVLLLTILLDLSKGPSRDWIHWLAITKAALGIFVTVAGAVWALLMGY